VREIVLMADPRVAAIPVAESGEALLDIGGVAAIRIDHRHAPVNAGWRQVRVSVLQRLAVAAAQLPAGIHLLHVEGYRPPALQARYFQEYRAELLAARPDLDATELVLLTSRHVSPPEIAPHSAGAAVDLTLCSESGDELDLGTEIDATPETSANACYTDATNISERSRANRAMLAAVMTTAGFINYPTEWWHWSFGDRYWALQSGQPTAHYGPVQDR
jgi:zinc D-Ala-D-Ala dipeptidase